MFTIWAISSLSAMALNVAARPTSRPRGRSREEKALWANVERAYGA